MASDAGSAAAAAGLGDYGRLESSATIEAIRFEELATDGTMRTNELVRSDASSPRSRAASVVGSDAGTGAPSDAISKSPAWQLSLDIFERRYVDVDGPEGKKLPPEAREFYRWQNEQIEAFREASRIGDHTAAESRERDRQNYKFEQRATTVSAVANVCLLVVLLAAVIVSGSMSLVASLMDGALDNFSTVIILLTTYYRKRFNRYRHPQVCNLRTVRSRCNPTALTL